MSVKNVAYSVTDKFQTELKEQSSDWNGRNVVIINEAYSQKHPVKAGGGEGIAEGLQMLGHISLTLLFLATAAVSAIAIGLATASLQTAVITFGVVSGCGALANFALFLYVR